MGFFKDCPTCGKIWPERNDFLDDPELVICGYQAHFKELKTGLFLFNHSCRGTLALELNDFINLYDGPVFTSHLLAPADCPRYCLDQKELRPCPVECDCHFVREIIQIIKNWPKKDKTEREQGAEVNQV